MDKEITTIQISKKLRRELNVLKHLYSFKNIEDVIWHYIKNKKGIPKVKNETNV